MASIPSPRAAQWPFMLMACLARGSLGGAAAWPLALATLFLGGTVQAQDWPDHLITMVVPYAAGGPVDTVGRIMAGGLSEKLRQQVVN